LEWCPDSPPRNRKKAEALPTAKKARSGEETPCPPSEATGKNSAESACAQRAEGAVNISPPNPPTQGKRQSENTTGFHDVPPGCPVYLEDPPPSWRSSADQERKRPNGIWV